MKDSNTTNPFAGIGAAETKDSGFKKLDKTPELVATSNSRAHQFLKDMPGHPEMFADANQMLDTGDYSLTVKLLTDIIGVDTIVADAKFLADCTEETFSSLLESRRSDRSKTKAKGLRTSIQVTEKFVACVYAEMLVRHASGKVYNPEATGSSVDEGDLKAITAKIKSLQSKASRLKLPARYDDGMAKILKETQDEIARLSALRPTASKTAVKSIKADDLRAALKKLDMATVPESDRAAYEELIAKLG